MLSCPLSPCSWLLPVYGFWRTHQILRPLPSQLNPATAFHSLFLMSFCNKTLPFLTFWKHYSMQVTHSLPKALQPYYLHSHALIVQLLGTMSWGDSFLLFKKKQNKQNKTLLNSFVMQLLLWVALPHYRSWLVAVVLRLHFKAMDSTCASPVHLFITWLKHLAQHLKMLYES